MNRSWLGVACAACALASVALTVVVDRPAEGSHPDLFYNYYVGPAQTCPGGVPARLYVAPRPTPPLVGHTYITYTPLMPHEFLYRHHRTYYRHYPHGGFSTARVVWW